ncbi:MAG: polysaccharide deacetylase family protein [Christiangramia sp.]|nr:polysaccharide deacetylase family protein [Christiangramia sp.]
MPLFLPKYPQLLKWLYPKRLSRLPGKNTIYLSFDDGPIPEVTPWVLQELKKFDATATFFCIGDNVQKHPEIFQQVLDAGHAIGNHTFHHLNGWKTRTSEYLQNTEKAQQLMADYSQHQNQVISAKFFRPPYGKIRNSQASSLVRNGYKIVMWDVISGDYNSQFSAEKCYQNVVQNTVAGSCIVFHDSQKAFPNLQEILPKILQYYAEKGWEFGSLTDALSAGQ